MKNNDLGTQHVLSFSSDGLHGDDRFALWSEISKTGPVGLHMTALGLPSDFSFRSQAVMQGGLGIMSVATSPCQIFRDPGKGRDLWESPGVVVNFVTAGRLVLKQDGRSAVVRPGNGALCVSDRPYALHIDEPFEGVIVKFDRRRLSTDSDLSKLTAISLGGTVELSPLLYNFAQTLSQTAPTASAYTNARLMRGFVDLLETSFEAITQGDGWQKPGHRRAIFERVIRFVHMNLHDHALTPSHVAEVFKYTPRYLNKLFAAEGSTSLGRVIWGMRLTQSAVDLIDPALLHESIWTIAQRNGFKDLAHFSRSFRAKFAMSPTDYRDAEVGGKLPLVQHKLRI